MCSDGALCGIQRIRKGIETIKRHNADGDMQLAKLLAVDGLYTTEMKDDKWSELKRNDVKVVLVSCAVWKELCKEYAGL